MTSLDLGAAAALHPTPRRRLLNLAWLLPALACSAAVYFPVTHNYFFADDFLNLYKIINEPLLEYLLTPNGGHLLFVRNGFFYLTYSFFGAQPEYYYGSALLTHLLNVSLLFRLLRLTTGSAPLASFGAALWGTSPFAEGSIGWYAVYGHLLVATVVLLILCQAQRLALEHRAPGRWMRWGWYLLALAGATCFGTGIAAALVLPFVLWLMLPEWRGRWWRHPPLVSLLLVVPVLYVVLLTWYSRLSGINVVTGTPWMSLFAEPLGIVQLWIRLIANGLTGLLVGFWFPRITVAAIWFAVLAAFVAVGGWVARASSVRTRRLLAAYALLAIACYGMIATARAILITHLAPGGLVPTRYHYAGQLALTVLLCVVLARVGAGVPRWLKPLLLAAWYGFTVASWVYLAPPIDQHDLARRDTERVLATITNVIRRSPPNEAIFIANRGFPPLPFSPAEFPGWAAAFVIFHPFNGTIDGRPIYFIELDPQVIQATQRGRRTRRLLVSREDFLAAQAAKP